MRYLVIDDDPVIRKLLIRLLNTNGDECVEASNHAEAMNQVGLQDFDAALVDVNLGGDDGLDLAVLLRDMRLGLKIVIMSADPENALRVSEAGLGRMLPKPFTTDELNSRLET